LNTTLYF